MPMQHAGAAHRHTGGGLYTGGLRTQSCTAAHVPAGRSAAASTCLGRYCRSWTRGTRTCMSLLPDPARDSYRSGAGGGHRPPAGSAGLHGCNAAGRWLQRSEATLTRCPKGGFEECCKVWGAGAAVEHTTCQGEHTSTLLHVLPHAGKVPLWPAVPHACPGVHANIGRHRRPLMLLRSRLGCSHGARQEGWVGH